jgi:hypothetical protein
MTYLDTTQLSGLPTLPYENYPKTLLEEKGPKDCCSYAWSRTRRSGRRGSPSPRRGHDIAGKRGLGRLVSGVHVRKITSRMSPRRATLQARQSYQMRRRRPPP